MWESLTIEEYAAFESAMGAGVVKSGGVWWRRVRPFFYQPVFPFQELAPGSASPPGGAFLGGYQHLVPEPGFANSRRKLIIWDNDPHYSLESCKAGRKNNIKKGLSHFTLRDIKDPDELITDGHAVYCSFYERTRYGYKKERVQKNQFEKWVRTLFRFPKVRIIGAYFGGKMAAVDISYLVQDVLILATAFSRTEYLKYQLADAMSYTLRAEMSQYPHITCLYQGAASGIASLDHAKTVRGSRIAEKPAFFHVNPLAHAALRTFLSKQYAKLVGTEAEAA